MSHVIDDGGRASAGLRGKAGDCVSRAIAIATQQDYQQVYDLLMARQDAYRAQHYIVEPKSARRTRTRAGISKLVYDPYLLDELGWVWIPTMGFNSYKRVHVNELPHGRLIASTRRHLVAVIDGQVHDTWDASHRIVYGYYRSPT